MEPVLLIKPESLEEVIGVILLIVCKPLIKETRRCCTNNNLSNHSSNYLKIYATRSDCTLPNSRNRLRIPQAIVASTSLSSSVLARRSFQWLFSTDKRYSPLCFVGSIQIPYARCTSHHRLSSVHVYLAVSISLSQISQHSLLDEWRYFASLLLRRTAR